jgi:sugar-specific transcriptional regulator TrmB
MNNVKLLGSEKKEIHEVLTRFGLSASDQAVYLSLLSLGESTLSPLSTDTGLKLTTVQSILKRLVDRGIILTTKRKSRTVYEADEPAALRRVLETQIEEINTITPLLKALKAEPSNETKVRIYGRERLTDIFLEALECKSKVIYEIVAGDEIQKIMGEKLHFTRRRVKAGVALKSLRVEAHEVKKYSKATHVKELREAKFLPRELSFSGNIFFWDTTVAFFGTKGEGVATVMQSPSLGETFSQLFELLWSVSRRMETDGNPVA